MTLTVRGTRARRSTARRTISCVLTCILAAGSALAGVLGAAAPAASAASAHATHIAAGSHGWTPEQAPLPADAATSPAVLVRQITCAAVGQCVGVASYNDKSGVGTGVIDQLHGGRWRATRAPLPRRFRPPQKVTLTSVSCANRASCGVSGYVGIPPARRSELLTLRRGHWTATAAPLLPRTVPDTQTLLAISCPRPGHCVSVGRYQGGAHGYFQGLIEVQSGARWHAVKAPLPADTIRTADPYGGVDWVSCPAAGRCTGIGAYVDKKHRRVLFADVLRRGRWHSSRLPLPGRLAADPLAYLGYVTCRSPRDCLAVGTVKTANGVQRGLFEREIAGKWHAAVSPNPGGKPADADTVLNEASCPTARFCAATGNYQDNQGNTRGVLLTLTRGRWHVITIPVPSDDRTNRFAESVSCPVAGWCVATGSTNITGLLETYARGRWMLTAAPLPAPGSFPVFQGTSVSCPSTRMCAAFGSYEKKGPPSQDQGLLETYRR